MMQHEADAVVLVQQWVHGAYGSRYEYGYAPCNVKIIYTYRHAPMWLLFCHQFTCSSLNLARFLMKQC